MRLLYSQIDSKPKIQLSRSIINGKNNGVVEFGDKNDYPDLMETIILNSSTAKSVTRVFAKFLIGNGFIDTNLENLIVGKDIRGKNVTVSMLRRQLARDLSFFGGAYLHVAKNVEGKTKELTCIPYKFCRFAKPDDNGYIAQIFVYDKWPKYNNLFKEKEIKKYLIYSDVPEVFRDRIEKIGFENYDGEVDYLFFDNSYLYPLSPLDDVYLDVDSEYQLQVLRNSLLRNGMMDKTILRVAAPNSEEDREKLKETIKSTLGVDGDPVIVLEDEVDEFGQIKKTGAFAVDRIQSNINDKLFENFDKALMNNIRRAMYAMPAILIDYEEGKLSAASGEAFVQAVQYYNAITRDYRNAFYEFLINHIRRLDNYIIQQVANFEYKELTL